MLQPALASLFNAVVAQTATLSVWRLYTITPSSGPIIRFADSDFPIVGVSSWPQVNGQTYTASTLRIDAKDSKTQWHAKIGLDVDQYMLVVLPRPVDPITGALFPDKIGNVPWLQAASGGALAAADFQVDEAYFGTIPTWPMPPVGASPVGCKTIFKGIVGEVDTTSALCVLNCNDYRLLLSIQFPQHYYSAQCRRFLFDAGCNADGNMTAAAFQKVGVVGAESTQNTIIGGPLPAPPTNPGSGTYTLGRVVMTSGLNQGFQRTVRNWDGASTLSLVFPFPFTMAVGDTFNITPGCNKLLSTCEAFANEDNFGGFPFIPAPEVQQ